jgi:hypothetical protein
MPIVGTFGADFSAFQSAVDQATTKLISFEGNATTVTNSLSRMEKSFSGVKIIQDATLMADAIERVGGVSKLTAAELEAAGVKADEAAEKMLAMGMKVPPSVQNIVDAAHDAKGAWGDFVHDFSATDAIEHPLSTLTSGVKALAAEMGPAAVTAVAWAGGIVAAGTALFELTEHAAKAGGEINDMSERTGISAVQLSKYSNAMQVAGGDLNSVGDAVFKLNKGLGEDSQKVSDGLEKIGISVDDLKAAGPDHYLELIAEGFAATEDPAARAAASAEIFRDKTGQMIPVLLKLNEGLLATNDITPWTTQQAADAEKFEMQLSSLKVHAEALGTAIGRDLIPYVSGFIEVAGPWVEWMAKQSLELTGLPDKVRTAGSAIDWLSAAYDVFKGKTELPIKIDIDTEAAKKKLKDLEFDAARTPDKLVQAWKDANSGVKMDDLQTALGNLNEMLGDVDMVTEDQIAANLKLKDAFAEVASAGVGWQGTVDTIDGAVVESIASYREAGVSMQALGVIYSDLTTTQLASIEKLMAARTKATEQAKKDADDQEKLEAKTVEMTTKLWDDYYLTEASHVGTATDLKRAALDKQYNDAAATANKMGIVDGQYWDALEARWKQGTTSLGIDWQALQNAATTQSKAGLQQIADGAQATYQEALKHVGEWSDGSIEKFRKTAEEAQKAADMFGTGWDDAAKKAKKAVDDMTASTIGSIHAIEMASASATINQNAKPYADTPEDRLKALADDQAKYGAGAISIVGLFGGINPIQTRDSGGPVSAGTPYLIGGGKQPEIFVPGADGFVTPNGMGGGGTTINTTINITQPFASADQIARAVGEAQVSVLKGQGVRLPYGT